MGFKSVQAQWGQASGAGTITVLSIKHLLDINREETGYR